MKISEMKINNKEVEEAKLNGQVVFKKAIDNLIVNVIYTPNTTTSGSVTVTLTANKKITAIQNAGTWAKSNDYTYKKVYTANSTQTAIIIAESGETTEVTVNVSNIDKVPTITVKTGATETIGNATDGYTLISFKIYDDIALKEYELNGTLVKLSASQWGDINYIKIGSNGAVEGNNVLILRDSAGNETKYEFKLIAGD